MPVAPFRGMNLGAGGSRFSGLWCLRILAVIATVFTLALGVSVLLPLVCAFFLFLLLDPFVAISGKLGIKRKYGSFVVVLLFTAVAGFSGFLVYGSLMKLAARLPSYSSKLEGFSQKFHRQTRGFQLGTASIFSPPEAPESEALQQIPKVRIVESPKNSPLTEYMLHGGLYSAVNVTSMAFFVLLITYFMLLERDALGRGLRRFFRSSHAFAKACFEIESISRGFFIGNFILGMGMSVCFAALFHGLKLEAATELALFAGFLNLVPVFGAILGAFLPAVQALLQFSGAGQAIAVALASIAVHFVGNNIVMPKLLGVRTNLNGTAAMIGFLFWGTIWGGPGLFLAIPLMAILRVVFQSRNELAAYANLLANRPSSGSGAFRPREVGIRLAK